MTIIGICGLKRSGKDTIAKYICDRYGYTHVKISQDLKHVMQIMFGFTRDQLELDEKEITDPRWGISPRAAMQFFGTEVMQYQVQQILPDIGRKFWIKSFIQKHLSESSYQPPRLVISDLRFLHEYEELKKHGIYVIRIEKIDSPKSQTSHISEEEYLSIPVDLIIKNTGSLTDLYEFLDKSVELHNALSAK